MTDYNHLPIITLDCNGYRFCWEEEEYLSNNEDEVRALFRALFDLFFTVFYRAHRF